MNIYILYIFKTCIKMHAESLGHPLSFAARWVSPGLVQDLGHLNHALDVLNHRLGNLRWGLSWIISHHLKEKSQFLDHFDRSFWDHTWIILDYVEIILESSWTILGYLVDHCRMSAFIHHDYHWRHGVVLQFTQMMTNPFNILLFRFYFYWEYTYLYLQIITHYGSNI